MIRFSTLGWCLDQKSGPGSQHAQSSGLHVWLQPLQWSSESKNHDNNKEINEEMNEYIRYIYTYIDDYTIYI